jgi:hypothetical protein
MLQINQQGKYFSETALLSGVAATDWSWSALFGDYNQDGEQDLFIFNGIPKRPNDLDYIKYISSEQIQKKITQTKLVDNEALDAMPSGSVQNYIFKGDSGIRFENKSNSWLEDDKTISNGSAYADFDLDGDLDIVTNNFNDSPTFYQNQTNKKSNYLKIKLETASKNKFSIGAKVFSYHNGLKQYKQLFTTKGFQSSSEPIIHFGYGKTENIDSLLVIWPDNSFQKLENIKPNQTLVIAQKENLKKVNYSTLFPTKEAWFTKINIDSLGIDYEHNENPFSDFNRQKLIPYKISDKGPGVAVGDLNGDTKDDIYFGSSRYRKSEIYLQNNGKFELKNTEVIRLDSVSEDISAEIKDFNQDGKNDIAVVSAGGEFYKENKPLLDKIYIQSENGDFAKFTNFPEYYENSSIVRSADYDNDGDLDIFIGGGYVSYDFGKIPNSYLLQNNGTSFEIIPNEALQQVGMVTDAIWTDFNNDKKLDLIVVGEWMSPVFFENQNNTLTKVTKLATENQLNGLWQSIIAYDMDADGDDDYIVGNWGLNTKLTASSTYPLRMYYGDLDQNGIRETVLATAKKGIYYPILGLDELSTQLVSIMRKKFTNYKSFSEQDLNGIFSKEQLDITKLYTVEELASGYLKNNNGVFEFHKFADELQVAPITRLLKFDFNNDGQDEVLTAGNLFGVIPFHGRFDANAGTIIGKNEAIISANNLGLNLTGKMVKGLNILSIDNKKYLLITIHDSKPELYHLNN